MDQQLYLERGSYYLQHMTHLFVPRGETKLSNQHMRASEAGALSPEVREGASVEGVSICCRSLNHSLSPLIRPSLYSTYTPYSMDLISNRSKMDGSSPFREANQSLLPRPTTSTFPLLSLPGEIRNRIYDFVFCEGDIVSYDLCEIYSTQEQPQACSLRHGQPTSFNPLEIVCKQLRRETEALAVQNRTFQLSVEDTHRVRRNLKNALRHSIHCNIDFKWLRNVVFVNVCDDLWDYSSLRIMKRDLRPIIILCSQIPHVQVKYCYDLPPVQKQNTGQLESIHHEGLHTILSRGINLTRMFHGEDIVSQVYPNLLYHPRLMPPICFCGEGEPPFPQVANLRVFPLVSYKFTDHLERLLVLNAEDFKYSVSFETLFFWPGVWRAYLDEWKTNGIGNSP